MIFITIRVVKQPKFLLLTYAIFLQSYFNILGIFSVLFFIRFFSELYRIDSDPGTVFQEPRGTHQFIVFGRKGGISFNSYEDFCFCHLCRRYICLNSYAKPGCCAMASARCFLWHWQMLASKQVSAIRFFDFNSPKIFSCVSHV